MPDGMDSRTTKRLVIDAMAAGLPWVLDGAGLVHPYPRPLAVRTADSHPLPPIAVERLGGRAGTDPLPVGMVVVTHVDPTAEWHPRLITPAQALLAVMDNTVAARRSPAHSMPILRQVVMHARTIQSPRGDSTATAARIAASMGSYVSARESHFSGVLLV